ncbi:GNAT family N-acetyltransferase [Capnocytophaga stomatis]|uniref:GNAT family N-acetyltransferase n=1 Tax=Capnocytophaga stomatis TaxID=1848904 RepID=A0A250G2X2_9FLAO|nr:GNAT family N-acetyltransferase [Capnocytophaga stomatis]ATA90668.1 GNAT family N-acetyltransferase [Capnocytophaga stomatis]GIJ95090.1 acetyltransferase [Capnocytophaga stomatis]GIM49008.1 acetyltransferase [Capnocytophaga stomatis]
MNSLEGEKIKLRALEPEDVDFLYELENQESLWEVSQTQIPFSRFLLKEYIQNAKQDIYEAKQFRYVISSFDNQLFGCIDLYDFDPKNKRACVGIAIFEKYQGKGIGKKSLENLVSYAKKYLDLYQLIAYIPEDNEVSIKLFEKLGFVSYGVKKDWIFSQGKFKDVMIYQKKL